MIDDTGHLKVADFGVSKLLRVATTLQDSTPLTCLDTDFKCKISNLLYLASHIYLSLLLICEFAFRSDVIIDHGQQSA